MVPGDGVTAALLKQNGIAVYGESEIEELLSARETEAQPELELF